MINKERFQKLPGWLQKTMLFLGKIKVPAKVIFIVISFFATIWFLFRVIPKPSRATSPCMQVAAPIMSGFVIWLIALTGATIAFKKAKHKLLEARYLAAIIFLFIGISATYIFMTQSSAETKAAALDVWYKPNIPLGVAKGQFPGRVAWGHNNNIASWDGTTGFWWEDRFNNQPETDKLLTQTLITKEMEQGSPAWESLNTGTIQQKRNIAET